MDEKWRYAAIIFSYIILIAILTFSIYKWKLRNKLRKRQKGEKEAFELFADLLPSPLLMPMDQVFDDQWMVTKSDICGVPVQSGRFDDVYREEDRLLTKMFLMKKFRWDDVERMISKNAHLSHTLVQLAIVRCLEGDELDGQGKKLVTKYCRIGSKLIALALDSDLEGFFAQISVEYKDSKVIPIENFGLNQKEMSKLRDDRVKRYQVARILWWSQVRHLSTHPLLPKFADIFPQCSYNSDEYLLQSSAFIASPKFWIKAHDISTKALLMCAIIALKGGLHGKRLADTQVGEYVKHRAALASQSLPVSKLAIAQVIFFKRIVEFVRQRGLRFEYPCISECLVVWGERLPSNSNCLEEDSEKLFSWFISHFS